MHWFRKAQYGVAISVIVLTGLGFATRIGNHSLRYVVTVYLMLAALAVVAGLIAWTEDTATGD